MEAQEGKQGVFETETERPPTNPLQGVIEGEEVGDENVLRFLDSMDGYLGLMDSLSATLRQGWFELASAKYSMGALRVNGALLDLKVHPAATSLTVTQDDVDSELKQPHFTLCKWVSSGNEKSSSQEVKSKEDDLLKTSDSQQPQNHGSSQMFGKTSARDGATFEVDNQVSKERAKSLSMFGTLVSPKLRAVQPSFETALETIVEIVNIQSSMLNAYDQVQRGSKGSKG
ncbi:coiled-coil domain-containing protein 115-like isoform X2 [Tripterygium wilfordii]|uniref:coiled-coil domain-containing protein 115-like isoform X2 n=1 Tax=Tripterygium wilfordii TaxID=458696 RepID=UPI0018F7E596|nr:coiled-coil domain-containing protein 115-like isoform X2 [Tripterygium wilfordii]